jgi:uncharacterized protein YicC (UPF0701 family)
MIGTIILSILLVSFLGLVIWATNQSMKKVKKDWDELNSLKEKFNKLETLDDITEFHEDFRAFANKIDNQYIREELTKMDGIIRGMYKVLKKQQEHGNQNNL